VSHPNAVNERKRHERAHGDLEKIMGLTPGTPSIFKRSGKSVHPFVKHFFSGCLEDSCIVANRLGRAAMKNLTFAVSRLTLTLALALPASEIDPGKAAQASTFLISSTVGYGVEDCLGEGGECGRVVADAWCEAHGRGAALDFGQRTEPGAALTGPPAYFITCGE
jgi:hypothetical protein